MVNPSPLSLLLILLAGLAIARLTAGRLARWAVPAILVELLVGFLLGNTVLPFRAVAPLEGLTELGVLSLFFQVGLEVRGELLLAQRGALLRLVAISALAPLLCFWPLQQLYGLSTASTLLCLAVLCATGTGVTLRALAQRQALQSPSGRLLVGVSVLDDLPAILLLALSTALGASSSMGLQAPLWFGPPLGILLGLLSLVAVDRWAAWRPERPSSPPAILMMLILSAWLGEKLGLTSLFGAFWGGMLLARLSTAHRRDPCWDRHGDPRCEQPQEQNREQRRRPAAAPLSPAQATTASGADQGPSDPVRPGLPQPPLNAQEPCPLGAVRSVLVLLSEVFLPLYFISVGMRVEITTLLTPEAWGMAAVLVVLAIVSKLACGFGVTERERRAGVDRRLVVYGLIPRGLPGLVFATTARKAGLISAAQFSALVLMVTFTTVVGLLLLERRLQHLKRPTAATQAA